MNDTEQKDTSKSRKFAKADAVEKAKKGFIASVLAEAKKPTEAEEKKPAVKHAIKKKVLGDKPVPDQKAPKPPKKVKAPVMKRAITAAVLLRKATSFSEQARKLREKAAAKQKLEKLREAKAVLKEAESIMREADRTRKQAESALERARIRYEALAPDAKE